MSTITRIDTPTLPPSGILHYSRVLWRRRWTVVAVTALLVVVALAYCAVAKKAYAATADLMLSPPLPTTLQQAEDPAAAAQLVDVPTALQLIESSVIAERVADAIGSAPTVSASEVGTTNVVAVQVDATTPRLAQRAANAYADAYISYEHSQTDAALSTATAALQTRLTSVEASAAQVAKEVAATPDAAAGTQAELSAVQAALEDDQQTLQTQIAEYQTLVADQSSSGGTLITPAALPTSVAKPKTAEYTVLALLLGLVLGMALAMILQAFEDASAGSTRLAATPSAGAGTPPTGRDPRAAPWAGPTTVVSTVPGPPGAPTGGSAAAER